MTDDELARLQALADAATPGPWVYIHGNGSCVGEDQFPCDYDVPNDDRGCHSLCYRCAYWDEFRPGQISGITRLDSGYDFDDTADGSTAESPICARDAAFIAASRDAIPALIAEARRLREENDEWHRISERWGRASGKQYGKLAAIRDLANARLADTAHMASIQEAETLWAIVNATGGE